MKRVLPKELYTESTYDTLPGPPKVLRLRPGFLAPVTDSQRVECSLDPAISKVFKDNAICSLKYSPEACPKYGSWNGGITWWKLCTDPALSPDPSMPTDQPEPRVLKADLTRFKAMTNPPRPPQIDYELEFSPAVISLSNPSTIKVNVKVLLRETTSYTVMWRKATSGPKTTALGLEKIDSFSFDVVNMSTGETLSGPPK